MNQFVAIGILLNSALYLGGAFVAGLATRNPWAWKLALAAAGVTYLCYCAQQMKGEVAEGAAAAFVILSVVLGLAAGVALLVGS